MRLRGGKHAYHYGWAIRLRQTKPTSFGSHKAKGNKTNTVLEEGSLEREGHFGCLRLKEGNLTHCWAKGLTEMKPLNFGRVKAEGNETNTVLGYLGEREGHILGV